jgi:ubiquinone/menaquinone biosynthesis C-methylase UbiE
MTTGWERIYEQQGDLGFGVLPKIRKVSQVFKEKGYRNILDLGCGTGRHSLFLAQQGFDVEATDLSPTGIKIARDKAESLGLHNIRFRQHEMKKIPFMDASFDAVVCTWTIYHGTISNIGQTLSEIYRVLKQKGCLIADFLSTRDSTYGLGNEIEKNTFVGQKPGEEDVPHHYSTTDELTYIFKMFHDVKIRQQSRRYIAEGKEYIRNYFDIEAVK